MVARQYTIVPYVAVLCKSVVYLIDNTTVSSSISVNILQSASIWYYYSRKFSLLIRSGGYTATMKCVPSQQQHKTQLIMASSMPFAYKRPYYGSQVNKIYRECTEKILHICFWKLWLLMKFPRTTITAGGFIDWNYQLNQFICL